ncbi:NACHT, LRR and PYD domains-containing protein 11-like [Nycticebus coucang]|uniref:NACHT, LRR and PYD domains-containing protein 11-like n=1 Tax=Nycticebus coucang TaxID=9470 RepID=UPI00234D4807|nr:NACHT, LRR and PYD domains-containing protein 11-like [Nycticebus coucang]
MAELFSAAFDLLSYLEKLSDEEFHSFKSHLVEEIQQFGPPEIPWTDLEVSKEVLVNMLTVSYEEQHTWNMTFSILQKLGRKDLCEKITIRRNRNKEMHKSLMRTKFLSQWETCPFSEVHYLYFCEVTGDIFYTLELSYDSSTTSTENLNVFLVGDRATGKSMIVKVAVIEWTLGEMWKDTISYIIHIASHEINEMTDGSLVELISKDWPEDQAPIADILSEPQKVLFILEDLDNMNVDLNVDESALCSDSRHEVPVSVLLVSLLKRKMVPGCWVLVSSRPSCEPSIKALMNKKDCYVTLQLSNEKKQNYFYLFFKNKVRAELAFNRVLDSEILVDLCEVPLLSWILCTVLNQQMNQADFAFSCQTPTDIYTYYLARVLASDPDVTAQQYHLILLNRLCLLALEGLSHNTINFSGSDLVSVGLTCYDVSVLQAMNILLRSSNHEVHYEFIHLNIQEFCAALACLMVLPRRSIPSAGRTDIEKRELYDNFSPVITFIFGLLNERRRKILETSLGCQLPMVESLRQTLLVHMKYLATNPNLMEHHMPLFYCFLENLEEEFVTQVMGFFSEATIFIQAHKDLMVSLYCLRHCQPLQKLKLSVQQVFQYKTPIELLTYSQMRGLAYWREICSLFHKKENFRELEICNSDLNRISEMLLSKALRHPNCQLQTLRLSYVSVSSNFDDLFISVAQNQNLTFLNVNCIPFSLKMFSLLREALSSPTCNIQHLSLMRCDLQASACQEIASILISSKKLKKLTLSNNPLKNDGVKILCDALFHPDCILESLGLYFCCLTEGCVAYISRVLILSTTLKHLELSVNYLQNRAVLSLTFPLSLPECQLQELELTGCFFTGDVCRSIASAIISNVHLRRLELGFNNLGDAGVKVLCNALQHRDCKLETVGLEGCMLTSACCTTLATVLSSSKTLKKLNLIENNLGDEGIIKLIRGLGHPSCVLELLGIRISDLSAETQSLLIAVREKNNKLG